MVIRQLTRRLGELSERRVGQIRQLSVPQLAYRVTKWSNSLFHKG
ncbi:DUF4351 domain-containing protein [Cylindrospermopsis raciborskii]|nr:DUF4351 domain-containing protein [Cylindrospermopsis raciborskii]